MSHKVDGNVPNQLWVVQNHVHPSHSLLALLYLVLISTFGGTLAVISLYFLSFLAVENHLGSTSLIDNATRNLVADGFYHGVAVNNRAEDFY